MNKLWLKRKPEIFQGENCLKKNLNYFEGWYFKISGNKNSIAFIPGININDKFKKAFIQVITDQSSYFVDYNISDFRFMHNPFYIKIGNNFFSKEGMHIEIYETSQNIEIYGNIKYSDSKNIITNIFKPNIMGPFSYVPAMECNHAILSMQNCVNGSIEINNKKIRFNDNKGYIEKDWGYSFPKSYIWCQGNCFKRTKDASFMLSVADIPFQIMHFKGLICALIIDNKEYKFTTYNNAKIAKYDIGENYLDIILKKGKTSLRIKSEYDKGLKLSAPVKGKMDRKVFENINSIISVTLKRNEIVLFDDISTNCGLEIS